MTFYPTTLGINLPIDNAIRDQIISEMSISDIYNSDYVALCITNVSNWELDVNEFNFINSSNTSSTSPVEVIEIK